MLQKHSLTRTTLIQITFRIAMVIMAVTLISYWLVISILEAQTLEQLSKYIIERGHHESSLFQLAEANQAMFKQEFLARYQATRNEDPVARFNQLFLPQPEHDLRKMRPEYFSGTPISNGAIIKDIFGFVYAEEVAVTPELRRRLLVGFDLVSTYGPAWHNRFPNLYIFPPAKTLVGYWPGVLWYPDSATGYDMSQQEWFYLADQQHNPRRETVWTGTYYDEPGKVWLVSCVTPVDLAGQHLLTVGNDLLLSDLLQRTINERLEGTYNLIFRTDGRLIAHPKYMAEIAKQGGQFEILREGDTYLKRIFQLVTHQPPNTVVLDNSEDQEYLAVTTIAGPDWYLVTVYPKSLLVGQALKTASFILMLGILSLLLEVAILFFVLRKQVAQPLTQFLAATQQIAAGNFEIQLDTTRPDELGWLAHSFNAMSQTLEREATKRTKELEEKNILLEQKIRERQETAEHLRQNQALLQGLLDHAPLLIFMKNTQGQLIHCNRQFESFFATRGQAQVLGQTDFDLLPHEIAAHNWQTDLDVFATRQPIVREEMATDQNGVLHIYLSTKFPLFDSHGDPYAVCGMATDITERKQAERLLQEYNQRLEREIAERTGELRASEERFHLAMQGANEGIWDWNLETGLAYISPRYRQILGLQMTQEFINPRQLIPFLHPEDVELVKTSFSAYLKKLRASYDITYRIQHTDGHYLWLLSRATAVWNEQGRPIRMVGTIIDITPQKQAETTLHEALSNLNQFKTTLDVTLDSVFMFDADTLQFSYVNQGAVNQLGYSQAELLQMTAFELNPTSSFPGEEYSQTLMMLLVEDSQKPALTFETIHLHKAGTWIPVEVFAQCISISAEMKYFIAIARDITERKQTEAHLQQATVMAEQARQAAELANQAKSAFLANMSHELRTPLNGILGYAQILSRDKNLNTKQREGIGIIQRSGEYLLTLINDVLDLSKIEAGRVELYPTEFNFINFLQGLRELFQMRAEQKGIAFIFEPLSYLPRGVCADEKRLRQVLINLLGNAVKFTERGGVTLKVGYEQDCKLRFQVEDTGVGIAAEELEKIFLPFQQVGHQNYRAEGTGLGLSITKKLVEMMEGELQVASQLGQGSTFGMVLDLPETNNLIQPEETAPLIIGLQGPPRKILVIDDKWENRFVLVNLLTPLGFELMEANHGQEGLEIMSHWMPDLILTDLVMPVMDGFEFARQLRKLPAFGHLPVVAVSASAFDWHQQESLAAGCNDFVAKPVHAEVLLESLRKQLGLTWIYEQPQPPATGVATGEELEEASAQEVGPSQEQAAILFDLAMMGDISGILEEIEKLEKANHQLVSFVKKVRQLARNFEEKQLCELLQRYIEGD